MPSARSHPEPPPPDGGPVGAAQGAAGAAAPAEPGGARFRRPGRGGLLFFAALTVWLGLLASRHEPWRDEADAWLMVRDNDLGSFFERLPYTGHQAPWYLALMALERLGVPPGGAQALALATMLGALAVLLLSAPFPPLVRGALALSFPLAYQYAIVARPYCLLVLALFVALALRPARFGRPRLYAAALVALALTASAGTLLAAGLMAASIPDLRLAERRSATLGILGYAAFGPLLAAAQAIPPEDGGGALLGLLTTPVGRAQTLFGGMGIPASLLALPGAATLGAAVNLLALAASVVLAWPSRRARWFLAVALGGLLALHLGLYAGGVWHAGTVFVAALAGCWIAAEDLGPRSLASGRMRRLALVPVGVVLAGSALLQVATGLLEIRAPYSVASRTAARLGELGLACRPIAAFRDEIAMSVLPHLPPRRFWYLGTNTDGSHMSWDRRFVLGSQLTEGETLARFEARRAPGEGALLLLTRPLSEAAAARYRLLLEVAPPPSGVIVFGRPEERYRLYAPVGEGSAASSAPAGSCGAWRRPVPPDSPASPG